MSLKVICKHLYVIISFLRFLPLLIVYIFSKNKRIIDYDVMWWCKCYGLKYRGGGIQLFGF